MRQLLSVLLLTALGFGQSVSLSGNVLVSGTVAIGGTTAAPPVCAITTLSLPSVNNGGNYNQSLQSLNCVTPTFAITSGSLSGSGLTLNSTGAISGTATTPGTYSFTVQITNASNTPSQALTITVTCTPVQILTTPPPPSGTQNQAYGPFQFGLVGGVSPFTWSKTGTLPTGMSLSTAGALSGTPTNSGSFAINVLVTDSCPTQQTNGPAPFTVTIAANTGTLAFNGTTVPNATIETAYSHGISAVGGTPPYTFNQTAGSLLIPMNSSGLVAGTVEDITDWIVMDSRRFTQHASGTANPHYAWIDADGQKLWSEKGSTGNPWDIFVYGTFNQTNNCPNDASGNPQFCHWITENGDENAFTNAKAYKRFVTPVPLAKRFFEDTTTDTILTTGTNPIHRTLNCELDGEPIINIGQILATRNPISTMAWGGNVGTQPTMQIVYQYSWTGSVYNQEEIFSYVKFWGLTQWQHFNWNGTTYVQDQITTTVTLTAGGAPTPNFPCGSTIPGWIGGVPGNGGNASAPQTSTPAITATATVKVTDNVAATASQSFTLTVNPLAVRGPISNSMCPVTTGGMDATAHLPLVYLCSAEANTPRTGSIVSVANGSNLQTAYNNASCGQWLQLTAGGTYSISSLAAKNCPDTQWIWITTAPSANLPREGTVTSPCYSNVTSLADYGSLNCGSSGAFTAKITVSSPIIITADHIRFENLEFAKAPGPIVYNLFQPNTGMSKIVFDRLWIHGNPNEEVANAIQLDGSSQVSIVENYFSDLHCISVTGACSEGHVIGTATAPGPFKISHNRLSAGSQYILFGGGSYTYGTPSDIEISYNHGFRPFAWNANCTTSTSCPGGVIYIPPTGGNPYNVKNAIEFKNAQRVLIFGNEWQNVWSGFSQVGNAITITPKSQGSGTSNLCPQCFTIDIVERYDWITYAAEAFQISNVANGNGAFATAGNSYSIHDVLADHLHYTGCVGCAGYTWQINADSNAPASDLLNGLTFNHLTLVLDNFAGTSLMFAGGPLAPQGSLVIQNSILPSGNYGIVSGGAANKCAFPQPASVPELTACFSPLTFTNNGIPWASGTSCGGGGCGGNWGTGQILAADQNAVLYTNLSGGNYLLQATSPFHNKATDGTDLGANIPTLNSYLANTAP